MFQISRRVDYAMRVMVELGQREAGAIVSTREISRRTAVPKAFLHKITTDLVKSSLVSTSSGPMGGLALAQPSSEITVLQIIEAIEGPISINVCLVRPHECPRDMVCPVHGLWGRLQTALVAELQIVTLEHLAAEAKNLKQHPQRPSYVSYLFAETNEQAVTMGGIRQ